MNAKERQGNALSSESKIVIFSLANYPIPKSISEINYADLVGGDSPPNFKIHQEQLYIMENAKVEIFNIPGDKIHVPV